MGGSSSSSGSSVNPMIMGALPMMQQQYAQGNLAAPQSFNLHPDTMSPQVQYARDLGSGLGNDPAYQSAQGTAGLYSGGGALGAYAEPNQEYRATQQGGYLGQNGVGGTSENGLLQQLISGGGMNGPAGAQLLQLIQGGGLSGQGQQLSQLASGGGLQGQAGQYLSNEVGGQYLSPDSNPFFRQMVDQSIEAARPGLDSQFASSGRYGSGVAANARADSADRIGTQLGYSNYQNERQNQQQAAGLLGGYQTNAQNLLAGLQSGATNTMAGMQYGAGNTMAGIDATAFQNERQRQMAAAQGLSNNISNASNFQLQGAGMLSSLLGQKMQGALSAADLQNQFDLGNMQDVANQFNYDQNRPALGLQRFMGMINGGQQNTTQTNNPSGISQAGQYIGAAGSIASAAALAIAI